MSHNNGLKGTCTVNGQKTLRVYIIALALIQFLQKEQNIVCNHLWLKFKLAVILQIEMERG